MRTITRLGAAVVMASFVAACSGGGGAGRITPGVLTSNPTTATVPTPATGTGAAVTTASAVAVPVTLNIPIPGRAPAGHSRIPAYVSVNTKGATFTVAQNKGGTMSTVAATATACTSTCGTSTSLIPGSYFFTVSLYDTKPIGNQIPFAANRLSTGSAQIVITAGGKNTFTLVLNGDVAKIKTTINPTAITKGSGVKPQTVVQAFDPSGALIVGALNKKIKTAAKGKSGKTVGLSVGRAVQLDERAVYAGARSVADTAPSPAPTNGDGSADLTNAGQPEVLDIPSDDSDPSVCVEASDDGPVPATTPDPTVTDDPTAQSVRRLSYLAPTPTPAPSDPNDAAGTDAPSSACVTIAGGNPENDAPSGGSPDLIGGNANGTPSTNPTPAPVAGAPFTVSTPTPVTSSQPIPASTGGVTYMQSFGIANALYAALNGNTATQVVALFSPMDASNIGPNPLISGGFDVTAAAATPSSPASTFAKRRLSGIKRHPSKVRRPLRVAKIMRTPFHAFRSAAVHSKGFRRVRNTPPTFPAAGATQNFFLAGASSTSSTVSGTVVATDTTASRYVVYATAGATADNLDPTKVAPQIGQMVANADTVVTGLFGDATVYSATNAAAAPNPQYVSVVVYDQNADVNSNSDTNVAGTIGSAVGFFNPVDLYTPSVVTSGITNQMPVIFVSWNGQTDAVSMANLQGAITREYSNLNIYIQNTLAGGAQQDAPAWIVAGLGGIADDYTSSTSLANGVAAVPDPSTAGGSNGAIGPSAPVYDVDNSLQYVQAYLYNPASYSLTAFAGISDQSGTYSQNLPGNYGVSYLFMKYFTDRLGLAFLQNLVGSANAGNVGAAAVVAAANAAGASYPTGTVNGSGLASTDGFTAMMQDFVTAQAAALAGATTEVSPSLMMQSFSLGNPNDPNVISSPVTGQSATLAGPNAATNIAITDTVTGTPPTLPLFYGAVSFFGVDASGTTAGAINPTNGIAIRVDDLVSGGLNLQGLVVQTGGSATTTSAKARTR